MLRNRLYYSIKPLVPLPVRFAIRRWFAVRKRRQIEGSWPIMPGSETPPEGWTGWPDGKRFALVLTHDVEGNLGLAKCQKLIELEKALGFRSAFNLIPEGEYTVSEPVLADFRGRGCEIGVHDLYHDGKLFLGEHEFRANAVRINHYLREWGAAGFRSGFMLHNLDWLHQLSVQYDASTFDTDPFEPQPQGRNTIFPFWVPRTDNRAKPKSLNGSPHSSFILHPSSFPGYVELPYTLPQDSTLFLLLRERHPDIWFQKLDWIARHGGMALVNVHPDYMRFEGDPASPHTYPADLYRQFLDYARRRYKDSFWQPLPRDLAVFVARRRLPPRREPRRICMVTHSYFLSDARVSRYAEALAERGDHVDVLALRRSRELPARESIGNVSLFRLQARYGKAEKSRLSHLVPVVRFLLRCSFWLLRSHRRNPYDLLHIHNVPDFLVFAAWYPKLTGAKVILDIHDIVPEFYASKFGARHNSFVIGFLKWLERVCAKFADHVIISNHLWRDTYASRNHLNGTCSVFINNVDSRIFRPRPRTRNDGKLIIIFPGGLQWHQGLDIAIRAFPKVRSQFPNAEFHIYGDGNMKEQWLKLVQELGLRDAVRFFTPLPVRQVAEIMANADLGVVPKRADSFGNEAYSTKIMEFMSLGIPTVVSSTKIDRFYFDDSVVRFFESGNVEALSDAMLEMLRDRQLRQNMTVKGLEYVARNNWDSRRAAYLDLVDSLISGEHNSTPIPPDPFDQPTPRRAAASPEPIPELAVLSED
ncbi:MAG TPA: glycosyltransferase [Verrucomicrobiae bacterium]|nr:glycosyltransferase [Verrucomicrobiae bacterium]